MMFNCFCQSLVPISVSVAVAALVMTAAGVGIGVVFALWKGNRKGRTDLMHIPVGLLQIYSLILLGERSEENFCSSTTTSPGNATFDIRVCEIP